MCGSHVASVMRADISLIFNQASQLRSRTRIVVLYQRIMNIIIQYQFNAHQSRQPENTKQQQYNTTSS